MEGYSKFVCDELDRASSNLNLKRRSSMSTNLLTDTLKRVASKLKNVDPRKAKAILISNPPFLYLSQQQIDLVVSKSISKQFDRDSIISGSAEEEGCQCGIIIKGEAYAIKVDQNFSEVLFPGESFGIETCLFGVQNYIVSSASEHCVVLLIPKEILLQVLEPNAQFALIIARNLTTKQNIFKYLDSFKTFVIQSAQVGRVEIPKLLKIYDNINSSLHPLHKSVEIDMSAWKYALQRLPEEVTTTFIYHVMTTLPDMYKHPDLFHSIASKARSRTVYRTSSGKNLVILRELVSDLMDFLANLCIHIIEARKLRRLLKSPTTLPILFAGNLDALNLPQELKDGLREIWGEETCKKLLDIIVHHEDFKVQVANPGLFLSSDPSERWTARLWKECQTCLGLEGIPVVEAINQGLTVDILQSSTKISINALGPYIFKHRNEIETWFNQSGIQPKTKVFLNEIDKLYAMSYYYFRENPDKEEERVQMNMKYGIYRVEETEMTGVRILLINVSKLDPKFTDPSFVPTPRGLLHLVVNIGYTFGKQSLDIVKCLTLLFGKSIASFNVIGKAGGLIGNRTDILVSNTFFDESTQVVTKVNPDDINVDYLSEVASCQVHTGPMLTVTGTILQNATLLKYYHYLHGCIGLEMEGAYFAQGIQQAIDANFIPNSTASRFLYYVSDLPLDSSTNLCKEEGLVSWDEGIGAMNAILRHCFQLIFKSEFSEPEVAEFKNTVQEFLPYMTNRLVVITSGGTSVPLEKNTVRSLENFSTGKRGASCAEYFLEQDYSVLLFARRGSLMPFIRHFSQDNLSTSDPSAVAEAVAKLNKYKEDKKLTIVYFKDIGEYLKKLEILPLVLKELSSRVMFLLGAAVSDFMTTSVSEHKIHSDNTGLKLDLAPVPKKLGLIKAYASNSFVISFKLETEPEKLLERCYSAMRKYGVDAVVGNILSTREKEIMVVTKKGIIHIEKSEADIEQLLVIKLAELHQKFIELSSNESE